MTNLRSTTPRLAKKRLCQRLSLMASELAFWLFGASSERVPFSRVGNASAVDRDTRNMDDVAHRRARRHLGRRERE